MVYFLIVLLRYIYACMYLNIPRKKYFLLFFLCVDSGWLYVTFQNWKLIMWLTLVKIHKYILNSISKVSSDNVFIFNYFIFRDGPEHSKLLQWSFFSHIWFLYSLWQVCKVELTQTFLCLWRLSKVIHLKSTKCLSVIKELNYSLSFLTTCIFSLQCLI